MALKISPTRGVASLWLSFGTRPKKKSSPPPPTKKTNLNNEDSFFEVGFKGNETEHHLFRVIPSFTRFHGERKMDSHYQPEATGNPRCFCLQSDLGRTPSLTSQPRKQADGPGDIALLAQTRQDWRGLARIRHGIPSCPGVGNLPPRADGSRALHAMAGFGRQDQEVEVSNKAKLGFWKNLLGGLHPQTATTRPFQGQCSTDKKRTLSQSDLGLSPSKTGTGSFRWLRLSHLRLKCAINPSIADVYQCRYEMLPTLFTQNLLKLIPFKGVPLSSGPGISS